MKKTFKLALAALALASSTALMARNTSATVSKFLEELGMKNLSDDAVLEETAKFLSEHTKIKRRLLIPIYRKRMLARDLICLKSTGAFSIFLSPTQLFDAATKKESFPVMIATNLHSDLSVHVGEAQASALAESIKSIANDIAHYVSGIDSGQRPFAGISDPAEFYARKITEALVHKRFREFIAQLLALVDRKNYRANDHVYNLIIMLLDQWTYWYQTDFYEAVDLVDITATHDEEQKTDVCTEQNEQEQELDEKLAKLNAERKEVIEHMSAAQDIMLANAFQTALQLIDQKRYDLTKDSEHVSIAMASQSQEW